MHDHRALPTLPAAFLAAMITCSGCSSPDRAPTPAVRASSGLPVVGADDPNAEPIEPVEAKVHAVFGRTLVIPVRVRGRFERADTLQVRLDDRRAVPARLMRVSVSNIESGGWLPPAGLWKAELGSKSPSDQPGFALHVVVATLPFDAVGQGLWLENHRIALNWLPEPPMLAAELKLTAEAVRWPEPSPVANDGSVRDLIEAERSSPLRRWRYRLVKGTLGIATQAEPLPPEVLVDAFNDPTLEAWARQREDRWIVGLKKLRATDPTLADELVASLRLTARFPDGVIAPVWNTDQGELEELVQVLLNPDTPDKARLARVRQWISARPVGTAWVVDDAGSPDIATGKALPTVALLNLTKSPVLGFVSVRGQPSSQQMTALEPLQTAVVMIPSDEPDYDPRVAAQLTTPVVMHVGDLARPALVADRPFPPPPSGLRLGAFIPDWSAGDLLAGVQPQADASGLTAAMLYRATDTAPSAPPPPAKAGLVPPPTSAASDAWRLYIECHSGGGAVSEEDRVTVFLGAIGPRSETVTISPDGSVSPAEYASAVSVVSERGRWVAQFLIPPELIEPDGTLRLAMTRSDRRGRRWTYPRPMLPWEEQPGRLAIATRLSSNPAPSSGRPTPR